jgi:hypothetical protein
MLFEKKASIPSLNLDGFQSDEKSRLVKPSYRVGLIFYPFDNDPVFSRSSEKRTLNWIAAESEGTVVSFSWSKRLGQPSGQWSAQIKLGRGATLDPMAGDLLDGDWVDLHVLRNGVNFPLARGVLDTVREAKSTAGGATVRSYALTGRDHGAMFETLIAWSNIFAQSLSELTQGPLCREVGSEVGGAPDDVFKLLVNAVFSMGTSTTRSAWALPPALKSLTGVSTFGELISVNTEPLRGALFNINLWTQAGQSLHQLLSQWCNPLLNEWRYDADTKPGRDKFSLFAEIRERPFVNTVDGLGSAFFGLKTWTIPNWLVTDSDLGRSGHERFTIFELVADWQFGTPQEQTALAPPIWSQADVTQYGIRPYLESTIFVAEGSDGTWVNDRIDWQRQLVDWFAINPYLLSGSVTFGCMLPEIKVGDRLIVDTGDPSSSLQAYIEGVDHSFQWAADGASGPRSSTTLTVTRGWVGKDADLLEAVKTLSKRFVEKE